MIELRENYGPCKSGRRYALTSEGRDWFRVRCKGRLIYVPKVFCKVL